MNIEALTLFKYIYTEELKDSYKKHRDQYIWPENEFPQVIERMCRAIEKGSFNKDSIAFRNTCKVLKIAHTYKAINQYLNQGESND